jgi:hypothetical protein
VSRFQFVADHRNAVEVQWLCAVMEIAIIVVRLVRGGRESGRQSRR